MKHFLLRVLAGGLWVASASSAVTINFDGLATGTTVTNQFSGVTFTSTTGNSNFVLQQSPPGIQANTSPNFICAGATTVSANLCTAETIMTFSSAVNNLSFFAIALNSVGTVAQVQVVHSGGTSTVNITGAGTGGNALVNLGAFTGVMSARVFNITDVAGIGIDTINYDVAGDPPPPPPPPGAIPEPSTFMLGGAFLAASLGLRKFRA